MTMYFYDDFWESLQSLKDRGDREAAAYAMLEYYFTGKSETENPIAEMAFGLVKGRIDKSIINQRNGAKGGAKKWQNASVANSEISTGAISTAYENATTNSNPNSNSNSKSKPKKKEYSIKIDDDREEYAFAVQCLKALNEIAGKNFKTIPTDMANNLSVLSERYTINDIRSMIRCKYNQWNNNPDMKRYIKPDTLFRLNNIERYIDESKNQEPMTDLSIYDEYD